MIDEVLRHLELAGRFEENAQRLADSSDKGPNWLVTYNQCLSDARRERAIARRIAQNRSAAEVKGSKQHRSLSAQALKAVTVGQILRWAAITRSSPIGTSRLSSTALRMMAIAKVLEEANVLTQLIWWAADIAPVAPGKTPATLVEVSAARNVVEFGRGSLRCLGVSSGDVSLSR